jgi:hypothetical protein
MTWNEVVEVLRAGGVVVAERPRWLGLAWRTGGGELRQRVELGRGKGAPHVVVTGEVVPLLQMSAVGALRLNAELGAGALAVEGETVVLRRALPLDELTAAGLETAVSHAAIEASRLRRRHRDAAGPTPHPVD